MKQTAVIYARVSSVTDRQDTQRQVQDLLKYAQAQDIEVVHIFEEHISGAKKNEERAILNECLDFCVANSVRFLLLSELKIEILKWSLKVIQIIAIFMIYFI